MNENFKKNFVFVVCYCIVKEIFFLVRKYGSLGVMVMYRRVKLVVRENFVEIKGEVFGGSNIDIKWCE